MEMLNAALEEWCVARRRAAEAAGRTFQSVFEWAMRPIHEIFLRLKARSRSLSLHEFCEVERMPNVRYRVLMGDPKQIAALILGGHVI
jgi:hypothetical protein